MNTLVLDLKRKRGWNIPCMRKLQVDLSEYSLQLWWCYMASPILGSLINKCPFVGYLSRRIS